MSTQVLHERPDFVRISGILDDVFHDGQDPGRVHPERVRHPNPVDLDRLELLEVQQHLGVPIEKFLKFENSSFYFFEFWSRVELQFHLTRLHKVPPCFTLP